LYPNTTHTHSKCRECFEAWEALGLCQNKLVRLDGAIGQYCEIQETSEDMTLKSPLVAGAWRIQVLWIN